ncbi:MAG: acyl-CoA dehydrogenase [Archangium sp.]|nr:acyl-CoA dehydrogenase [Archangium sp.]
MSTAHHYKPNVRDTLFNLFEFLEIQKTSLGKAPFGDIDEATVRQTIDTMIPVCTGIMSEAFTEGDRIPLDFNPKTGAVTMPPLMQKAFASYFETGMHLLDLPSHLGGLGAPPTLAWGSFEFVIGANPAAAFSFLGNVLARIIDTMATEEQKKRFVGPMLEKHWGGSMVLTEPDAGSDVGAARAKAKLVKDDLWHIEGVKRFITNGDIGEVVENTIHLVLARPEGAGPGTKGLSMFIVPKFLVNADGSLGERNGVYCTNLEKKMGLKASATCEMTFGDSKPAVGWLVGNVHDGMRQMFHVIEHARMAVGLKSMATLSTAYLNALSYVKERKQGADLKSARDKNAPRVTVIHHPEVRRMLMMQKSHAEGMRALILFNASLQDQVELLGGHKAPEAAEPNALNDLILPLIKGYCSEKVYDLLSLSLQCYGGSGYLQDYPAEQYIRDQKIDSLYEGTTAIQALDLLMRKVAKDGGATLQGLMGRISQTLETNEGGDELKAERASLAEALGHLQAGLGSLMEKLGDSVYHVGLQGNRVLYSLAEVTIGWLLVRHAAVAVQKVKTATGPDVAFYEGKIASARFFCAEVLPQTGFAMQQVQKSSLAIMELSEEAF